MHKKLTFVIFLCALSAQITLGLECYKCDSLEEQSSSNCLEMKNIGKETCKTNTEACYKSVFKATPLGSGTKKEPMETVLRGCGTKNTSCSEFQKIYIENHKAKYTIVATDCVHCDNKDGCNSSNKVVLGSVTLLMAVILNYIL